MMLSEILRPQEIVLNYYAKLLPLDCYIRISTQHELRWTKKEWSQWAYSAGVMDKTSTTNHSLFWIGL